jgi:hypothetical protein
MGIKKKTRKNIRKNKGKIGGMETAENVYIPTMGSVSLPNDPTKIPKSFQNSKRPVLNVTSENIYENVTEGETAPIEAQVLATTGKSRNLFTRAYHKMGKLIGSRPTNNTLTTLDFDLTLFDNTCLKDVPLTVEEINIFKSIENKNLIKLNLNLYCNVRKKLFEKDIHFDTKYPKIFEQMLRLVFLSNDSKSIDTELRGILFRNDVELEDYEEDIVLPQSEYISNFESLLPREYLYERRLNKSAGKRRTRHKIKSKKQTSTKRRYHK